MQLDSSACNKIESRRAQHLGASMTDVSVAILDTFHGTINELISSGLPPGWRPVFAAGKSPEQQRTAIRDADVTFVMAMPVGAELLASAAKLQLIQKLGAGTDRIDLAACRQRNIAVARLHGGNAIPVAEHTLLLMLAVCRRLPLMDRRTRNGAWDKEDARGNSRQLRGKRIGLVGFGAIGQMVCRLLSGFDAEVVYFDPAPRLRSTPAGLNARQLDLDELLATSDIVSLHLPLLPDTAGIIDAKRIAAMKPGAVLINCARGGLVDEPALADALASGRLFGAGIDVFSQEPPLGNPLLASDRTVVTPHLAGATLDNFASIVQRAADNARHYLESKRLPPGDAVFSPHRQTG